MSIPFIDVHCHIIPGVDDGAGSIEEALELLRMEQQQGARELILSPHSRRGYFETSRDTVEMQLEQLSQTAIRTGLAIPLHLGCEFYRINEMEGLLKKDGRYRMAGTRYVLLEFMPQDLADTIWRCTGDLLLAGFRPVIAHAERYQALRNRSFLRRLLQAGAYIQINAGSILGESGWGTKRFCKMLLKEGLVHFVGSDAHNRKGRVPCMGPCGEYLSKKLGNEEAKRLLLRNPEALLAGNDL